MVVPVMMQRARTSVEPRAYRAAAGAVNPEGTDAFESAVRLSWTPYTVPSGAIQIECASPCRPPRDASCPILPQRGDHLVGGTVRLERRAVRQPLVVHPREIDGLRPVRPYSTTPSTMVKTVLMIVRPPGDPVSSTTLPSAPPSSASSS
jgi:hypothetical protein